MSTTKELMLAALGSYGDSSGDLDIRSSIGTPGYRIKVRDEIVDTGQALTEPSVLPGMLHAVGQVFQRRVLAGTTPPTSGQHDAGEFMLNTAGGAIAGWLCTASGTPGTWVALYLVYGTPAVGMSIRWTSNARAEWSL